MEAGPKCFLYSELELFLWTKLQVGARGFTWHTALNMANWLFYESDSGVTLHSRIVRVV
jgi:hypothetical protein